MRARAFAGVKTRSPSSITVPRAICISLWPPPVLLNQPLQRLSPSIASVEILRPYSAALSGGRLAEQVGAKLRPRIATYTPRGGITSAAPKFIHLSEPGAALLLRYLKWVPLNVTGQFERFVISIASPA